MSGIKKVDDEYTIEELKKELKKEQIEQVTKSLTLNCSICDLSEVCPFYNEEAEKCHFNTNDIEVIIRSLLGIMVEQIARDILRKKKVGIDSDKEVIKNIKDLIRTIKDLKDITRPPAENSILIKIFGK